MKGTIPTIPSMGKGHEISSKGWRFFYSTGSTFNRGDFTATNAFFWSSLDLFPYAGTDTGSALNYIEVLDAAGKKATGYLAAVGAGETLGSELLTGWTNYGPPYSFDVFTTSGKEITSAIDSDAGKDETAFTNNAGFSINQLIKLVTDITLNSGTAPQVYCGSGEENFTGRLLADETIYFAVRQIGGNKDRVWIYSGVANLCNLGCTFTMKQVTDPPATAVHIVSSLNGTTRNWASIESGFDPNTITSWVIFFLNDVGVQYLRDTQGNLILDTTGQPIREVDQT